MDNKKKKTLSIVLGIFALVIVTTAASFAFFTYSRTGTTTSTIISGDIEFSFIEGKSATLANAFPVADSIGAVDTTGEYSFDVRLSSSSNSNKMNYNVLLVDNNDEADTDYFNNEQIKFAIVKNNTYVANTSSTSGVKLSDIDGFDELSNQGEGIILQDQEITAGTTDNYKLRIWISDDVNYSNTQNGQDNQESIGKYNSYKYSLKVKVTSGTTVGGTIIGNLVINNKTMTVDLRDPNGLSAYAVTTSSSAPGNDSSEWVQITDGTAKSNVQRTANGLVITKTISYTVSGNGKYYLHVKNKLNQISKKEFVVNVTGENAVDKIVGLAQTNTNDLRIDQHEATGQQTFSTTEYRYYGANPNNYVEFNNELWRIIGAMDVDDGTGKVEKRLKIIRNGSVGSYAWDSSDNTVNNGSGVNEWSQADLMTLLNSGAYYNRTTGTCYQGLNNNATSPCDFTTKGLTSEAKEMIGNAKWYLGASSETYSSLTALDFYRYERGTNTGKQCSSGTNCTDKVTRITSWTGEIGLIYPSDYGYSANMTSCASTALSSYSTSCKDTSWLYKSSNYQFTISSRSMSSAATDVFGVHSSGYLVSSTARQARAIYPVTYLKSNIQIVDGFGSKQEPFKLSK